jgi:DEAD/DEAH box helicase
MPVPTPDRSTQLKLVSKRNIEIKKSYEMSLQGIVLDPANFEPEVTLVQRLRQSTNEQLRNQYDELKRQARPITVRHERVS